MRRISNIGLLYFPTWHLLEREYRPTDKANEFIENSVLLAKQFVPFDERPPNDIEKIDLDSQTNCSKWKLAFDVFAWRFSCL